MASRTIAIGDIHGCAAALQGLLADIELTSDDTLVVLGDMIDRGPESAEVIETLLGLVSECRVVPLMGNHERMMLDAVTNPNATSFWLQHGGRATLGSYGGSLTDVPSPHRMFFKYCMPYFETETHLFVHACYDPYLPLERVPEDITLWKHVERTLPPPHFSGKIAVVGHTPQASGLPRDGEHIKLLDTFCYGGQWLTAWDVDSDFYWQADNRGRVRRRNWDESPE